MLTNPIDDIVSPRLTLRLIGSETIKYCLEGDLQHASNLLNADIPAELLNHPSSLTFTQKQLDADPSYLTWSTRAIMLTGTKQMVVIIRFHTTPDPEYLHPFTRNAVELGYTVFTPYRRQGHATESVSAMMHWATTHFGISRFVASVSPQNMPSLNLIARFGFYKIGEVMDETDGMEHVFLRGVSAK